MSKRRAPTAGTFARLAVASAVACAALPEIVDLAMGYLRHVSVERAPSRDTGVTSVTVPSVTSPSAAGPRVMGAYHTADDAVPGVDRFSFAAGSPFDDVSAQPGAVPDLTGSAAGDKVGIVPDRMAPEAERESAPSMREPDELFKASEPAERPRTREPNEQHMPLEDARPAPSTAAQDRSVREAAAPAAAAVAPDEGVPADGTPVAPPAAAATAPIRPPASETRPVAPATLQVKPAPVPKASPAPRVEPRAPVPQEASKRPAAAATGKPNRARSQSAAAGDEGPAAKPVWRPENLNNWPD